MLALLPAKKTLQVSSPAFQQGQRIPSKHTCDGADTRPALLLGPAPAGTKSIAVIVDDPDAPRGTWTHWTAWNLPPNTTNLPEGQNVKNLGGREGRTDSGLPGYHGPCPPPGTHRYFFKVFALDAMLDTKEGAKLAELEQAMNGRVVAWGELMGTYSRS